MTDQPFTLSKIPAKVLTPWLAGLTSANLESIFSAATLERGTTYAQGGAVQELKMQHQGDTLTVEAVVRGTDNFLGHLQLVGNTLTTRCNCIQGKVGEGCKHQVALALMVRGALMGQPPILSITAQKTVNATQKRAQTKAKKIEELKALIAQFPIETLQEWVFEWAMADKNFLSALRAEGLHRQAALDPQLLQKNVLALCQPQKSTMLWGDLPYFLANVIKAVALLYGHLKINPTRTREITELAMLAVTRHSHHIDDSRCGEFSDMKRALEEVFLAALAAAPPTGDWILRWDTLIEHQALSDYDDEAILQAAGEPLTAQYCLTAQLNYQKLIVSADEASASQDAPSRGLAGVARDYDERMKRERLIKRYLLALELQGDINAAIAVMKHHAQEEYDYRKLVEFCEKHQRFSEALELALLGDQLFPKGGQIKDALMRCYQREGMHDQALALQRQWLESQPSPERFHATLSAAQAAKQDVAAYRKALYQWAEAQETDTEASFYFQPRQNLTWQHGVSESHQGPIRLVTVRVRWLIAEKLWQEALTLINMPNAVCNDELVYEVAQNLPHPHPDALALFERVINNELLSEKTPYRRSLAMVRQALLHLKPAEQKAWVQALMFTYKAKRTFVQGLPLGIFAKKWKFD